jgi:hypothetical protein
MAEIIADTQTNPAYFFIFFLHIHSFNYNFAVKE